MSTDEQRLFAEHEHPIRLVTETLPTMYGRPTEETWAVAVLDDGTEIRMRHLGDRVEVRGWDPKADCRPPSLRAEVLGHHHHIVDVSAAEQGTPPESPSGLTAKQGQAVRRIVGG